MSDDGRRAPEAYDPATLGGHTAGQLHRLCRAVGLSQADATAYAQTLTDALGPAVARRSLDLPPPTSSFLSDDHTPVEFSLSFAAGSAPTLRVLLEPGGGLGGLAQSGRTGLRAVRELARSWDFATDRLDELEDLFFPTSPEGPLALWCALELRAGGVPNVKVYLNPAASGAARAAATVSEALQRLGHRQALLEPQRDDRFLFFALDLGDWEDPRVKVYTAHHDLSALEAGGLSRMEDGPQPAEIEAFFRTAAGITPGRDTLLDRRPVQTCHAFTRTATGLPGGFTLYVPVRDYVRHDGEALARAAALLRRYDADPGQLVASLEAVTSRRLEDSAGLIAYLALAHQRGRPPRVTVYISSEAYARRPRAALLRQPATVH
ncbi:tryptophan dimethylallyltransferase family protein [Streptacidiphilus sp. PB12-B1b]|uniref:tryptophan dimethylallyltransferase family protein n=1 Tax=Streptacidiphilus sp. PB12-B1b TaxID=2705012 RepID=UPI001CDBD0FF|nr:tryptophan dimethylallyltransferase family protein [Streptacidiphilus sp. PB12-B1b]